MTTKTVPPDRYLERLRVLGAWWRLGSSALEPRLLIEVEPLEEFDPHREPLVAHGGVALSG